MGLVFFEKSQRANEQTNQTNKQTNKHVLPGRGNNDNDDKGAPAKKKATSPKRGSQNQNTKHAKYSSQEYELTGRTLCSRLTIVT